MTQNLLDQISVNITNLYTLNSDIDLTYNTLYHTCSVSAVARSPVCLYILITRWCAIAYRVNGERVLYSLLRHPRNCMTKRTHVIIDY